MFCGRLIAKRLIRGTEFFEKTFGTQNYPLTKNTGNPGQGKTYLGIVKYYLGVVLNTIFVCVNLEIKLSLTLLDVGLTLPDG